MPDATPAALMNRAFDCHAAGRLGEAMQLYRAVLSADPSDSDAAYYLGIALIQAGAAKSARPLLEACIGHRPPSAEAWVNLGVARRAAEDEESAMAAFDAALALDRGFAPAWVESGGLAESMGALADADTRLRTALDLDPKNRSARLSLAIVCRKLKRLDEAAGLLDGLAADFGDDADIAIARSLLASEAEEAEAAVAHARTATERAPDRVAAWIRLSKALALQGSDAPPGAAIDAAREAVRRAPETVTAHLQLYRALSVARRTDEAVAVLLDAIRREPNNTAALEELAKHYDDHGYTDEARRVLDLRLKISDDPAVAFKRALLMPIVADSAAQIDSYRRRFAEELTALRDRARTEGLRVDNPVAEINRTNFFLAYHGIANLSLQKLTVETLLALSPGLAYTAPHCVDLGDGQWGSQRAPGGKIRIGFASKHFRNHTIAKLNVRLIESLPRDRFHVTVIHVDAIANDFMRERIDAAADEVVVTPAYLHQAWQDIGSLELDILYYPDIGMDSGTYFLSYARLAPLQVYTWGHPDSVATPGLDAFLSSRSLEVADSDRDYGERLVRFSVANTCYEFPDLPSPWKTKAEMGLPTTGRLYGVPQTLYKFHPDVDFVYQALIERDPDGWIVIVAPPLTAWLDKLRERWARTAPAALPRLVALPGMPREDYLAMCRLFDVMIDPPHYTGGNSSLEALAVGTPIVTWSSRFLRGRITGAFYEDAGIDGLTVERIEDVAPRAVEIATDPARRQAIVDDIEARRGCLFENRKVVDETAAWLAAEVRPRGCG